MAFAPIEWVKAHKYTTAALVVGMLVTYVVVRRMIGSGSTTVVAGQASAGPTDAELQLAAVQSNAQAQLAAAGISADVSKYTTDASEALGLAQLAASEKVSLAQIDAQQSMFTIQNSTALDAAQIQAKLNTDLATLDYNTNIKQIDSTSHIFDSVIAALTPPPPAPVTVVQAPPPAPVTVVQAPPPAPHYATLEQAVLASPVGAGIAAEYARLHATADPNSPQYNKVGAGNINAYVDYWYNNLRDPTTYSVDPSTYG
jgi:hypothetical protein